MKKVFALFLVVSLILLLGGCAGGGSGVTIEKVQSAFKTEKLEFEEIKTEEKDDGLIITGKDSSWDVDIELICEADKRGNINKIKIINTNIDVSVYDSEQGILDIYSTVSTFTEKTLIGKWSIMGPLCCMDEIDALTNVCEIEDVNSLNAMISDNDIESKNWKISIAKDKEAKQIVIEAIYLK